MVVEELLLANRVVISALDFKSVASDRKFSLESIQAHAWNQYHL